MVDVISKVMEHKSAAIPAIQAGKDVFVEWPLAVGVAEAEELAKLAKEKGIKTVLGLQTRHVPAVVKVCDSFHAFSDTDFSPRLKR